VATKTTLNSKNLQALGAERLAELLIEISSGNAAAKRRLRLELAGARSPGELAKEVRKRLTTIARSRSFVDWQGVRSLAGDLDTQRRAIVDKVAKTNPKDALDLLWRLMALASSVFERCDDSNGTVTPLFGFSDPPHRYHRLPFVIALPAAEGGSAGQRRKRPSVGALLSSSR
jgi:hypothetical protein